MTNDLKRKIAAFHELLRLVDGVRAFTYVERGDAFEVVSDANVDLKMISALVEDDDLRPPTMH
jgi:hypothetical protein